MKWFNTLSHNRWLEQETDRIFDFGKKQFNIYDGWLEIFIVFPSLSSPIG